MEKSFLFNNGIAVNKIFILLSIAGCLLSLTLIPMEAKKKEKTIWVSWTNQKTDALNLFNFSIDANTSIYNIRKKVSYQIHTPAFLTLYLVINKDEARPVEYRLVNDSDTPQALLEQYKTNNYQAISLDNKRKAVDPNDDPFQDDDPIIQPTHKKRRR